MGLLNTGNISGSAATNAAMQREINIVTKKLYGLLDLFDRKGQHEILKPAAKLLVSAARGNIKDSKKLHHRYSTAKLSKNIRAPKGKGNVIATYYPGNLRKSIRTLLFRRSKAVFVGPRLSKRNTKGEFGKGSRVDGYYAHWMERGSAHFGGIGYMRRAYETTKGTIKLMIKNSVKRKVLKYGNSKFGKFSNVA